MSRVTKHKVGEKGVRVVKINGDRFISVTDVSVLMKDEKFVDGCVDLARGGPFWDDTKPLVCTGLVVVAAVFLASGVMEDMQAKERAAN